jgi:hypothetical protein
MAGLLNSPAFSEVQITLPKTNYLVTLHFADTARRNTLCNQNRRLDSFQNQVGLEETWVDENSPVT